MNFFFFFYLLVCLLRPDLLELDMIVKAAEGSKVLLASSSQCSKCYRSGALSTIDRLMRVWMVTEAKLPMD